MLKVLTSFSIDHVWILLEGNYYCHSEGVKPAMWVTPAPSLPQTKSRHSLDSVWKNFKCNQTWWPGILNTMEAQEPWLSSNLSNLQNVPSRGFAVHWATWSRGGGAPNKVFYGESLSRVLTPYPFIYHFWQKRHPFGIPSVELCILFNCCKCSLFQISINLSLEHFLDFFKALKCIC